MRFSGFRGLRVPGTKLAGAGLLAVLAEVAGIALTGTAAWLIVKAAEQPPLAALTVAIVVVRTLAIARGGLRYAERLAGHAAVLTALAQVRGQVYAALTRRRDLRSGDALTRVVSDVDALQDALLRCIVPAFVAGVVGVAGIGAVALVSGTAAVVLACGLVALTGLALVAAKLASRTAQDAVEARARLADHMVDLIHGSPELEIYGARERKLRDADAAAEDVVAVEKNSGTFLTAIGVAVQVGTVLALVMSLPTGPVQAAVVLGVLAGMEVFLPLIPAATRWAIVRPAVERVSALLTAQPQEPRPAPAVEIDLSPGKHTAIVGPSGAGKSTLLAAIAHLEPDARGAMADGHVFTATIRENLSFAGNDFDTVAELVHLDGWIGELPDGWDTSITSETVSGGQRQRLVLARALIAKPPVLLLDEPVEGLEVAQGDRILADVLTANRDRAVVLVTHRLTQLTEFEDIVVLEQGRVIQRGSHGDLVAEPGYYRASWEAESLIRQQDPALPRRVPRYSHPR
jgi:ATP-binding cassette subfamily C protein CydC